MEYLIKLPWRSSSCYSRAHRHAGAKRRACVTLRCERNKKHIKNFCKRTTNAFGCINVIIHNNHWHVSVTHMAICGVGGRENKRTSAIIMCRSHSTAKKHMLYLVCFLTVRVNVIYIIYIFLTVELYQHIIIVFVFLFSSPRGWPHEWLKHVGDYCIINLHSYTEVYLLAPVFNYKSD